MAEDVVLIAILPTIVDITVGGSGYVYTSSTASNYPSGCLLNSGYYLSSASTEAGKTSFLSTSGSTEKGYSGNGYIQIVVLSVKSAPNVHVKLNGIWKEPTSVYVKDNGIWKETIEGYIKVNGVWKKC